VLQALNSKGLPIKLAAQTREKINRLRNERFFCPQCYEPVIIKAGPKTIPHFAHRSITNCINQRGEGAYHERGKLLLYEWLKKQNITVQLEQYIPEIEQIPDMLVTINNKRIALEYQCSNVSVQQIKKRNKGYIKANIIPIWILGETLLKRYANKQIKMDFFTSQFIHYFPNTSSTSLFYFCPHTKKMIILNDIYLINMKRAIGKITIKKLDILQLKDLFIQRTLSKNKLLTIWLKEKRKFRLNQRKKIYGRELQWRNWLYNRALFIENLPSCIYLPIASQQLLKTPPWQWQSKFIIDFIHPLQIGEQFTLGQAKSFLNYKLYKQHLFPLLQQKKDPVIEYLNYLKMIYMIIEQRPNVFMKNRNIRFYRNIEEAISGDENLINYIKNNA